MTLIDFEVMMSIKRQTCKNKINMLHVHQSRNKQVPLWSKLKGQTGHRICPLLVSLQVITKLKKKTSILKLIFVAWFQIQSKKVNFLSAFIVLFFRTLNVLIIGMGYITCGKGGGGLYQVFIYLFFIQQEYYSSFFCISLQCMAEPINIWEV